MAVVFKDTVLRGLNSFKSDINRGKRLDSLEIIYNDQDHDYLVSVDTLVPDTYETCNNANTGLAYDPIGHRFFSGGTTDGCGQRTYVFDRNLNQLKILEGFGQQGIAYDWTNGRLYAFKGSDIIFVRDEDVNSVRRNVVIDNSIDGAPGCLAYDPRTGQLWSRPLESSGKKTTLHELTDRSQLQRNPIKELDLGGDEGIAVSPFEPVLWIGFPTKIQKVDFDGKVLGEWENPSDNYSGDGADAVGGEMEGMVVDPTDNTIWFNSDQFFHGGINGGNRIWRVDPNKTYDKKATFPNQYHWKLGKVISGLTISGDKLYLAQGETSGTWYSPIIDFGSYTLQQQMSNISSEENGTIGFAFRGSDSQPTTAVNDQFTRDYYDANNSNDGWGSVTPSSWQSGPTTHKYMQLKITLS